MESHPSDGHLLMRIKQGRTDAFNVLYERYWAALYRLAVRILEDTELAKDVIQEVFVSFYQSASHKEIIHVRAYLYQSVKLQCFMQLRSGRISDKHLQQFEIIEVTNEVEEEFDARQLKELLDQEIAALPDKCREVFYLSRYESLSNKKIAEQLNISQKTVENQITKALKTLRVSVDKLIFLAIAILGI